MPDPCPTAILPARKAKTGGETFAAVAVLCGLLLIAAGIFIRQPSFNPAVLNLSAIADSQPKAAGPHALAPLIPAPAGLTVLTPVESFDRETLSDKIDGKAELYLSAGFVRLDCQRLALSERPDAWLEVFVYDMGSAPNAFAVFSTQRRADVVSLSIGDFAYRAGNALFVAHGHYYLELIASADDERLSAALEELAESFIRSRAVAAAVISEQDLFPKAGLIEASITLIAADAFGVAGLDRVFTATYQRTAGAMTAFLSRRADADAAAEQVRSYAEFLSAYGGKRLAADDPVPGATVVEIMDTFMVVFAQGPFFAGVHEAPDKTLALELARELAAALKEVPHAAR
ncbi:MAG: hypothetical protein MUD16_10460 [Desulfobacterales bacterium]|nr:hypothetical protein [Desulfobacterales bacterium]